MYKSGFQCGVGLGTSRCLMRCGSVLFTPFSFCFCGGFNKLIPDVVFVAKFAPVKSGLSGALQMLYVCILLLTSTHRVLNKRMYQYVALGYTNDSSGPLVMYM